MSRERKFVARPVDEREMKLPEDDLDVVTCLHMSEYNVVKTEEEVAKEAAYGTSLVPPPKRSWMRRMLLSWIE